MAHISDSSPAALEGRACASPLIITATEGSIEMEREPATVSVQTVVVARCLLHYP
jgi:hypothetical protein